MRLRMGMRLTCLELADFRNYERYRLNDIAGLTIFIGRNGVGKTNVLEAIGLLTSARSFKHSQIGQLIRQGSASARLTADFTDENRQIETSLFLEAGKKRFTVNGKAKTAADVRGILPAVSFIPDDLEIAKRSSSVKRDALDALGGQVSKNYYVIRRDYEKALRYKNKLLKDEAASGLVEAINDTLLTCATQLFCYRHALQRRMVPVVRQRYADIAQTSDGFEMSYLPSWEYLAGGEKEALSSAPADKTFEKDQVKELLEQALLAHFEEERRRKHAIVGPHNDKISFNLGGRDVSQYASQGQQRSIVLAWKLAEVDIVRQTLGVNPVLLLDDVMSELDEHRRDMLVTCVGDDIQAFVTATDLSPFNERLLDRARVVELGGCA